MGYEERAALMARTDEVLATAAQARQGQGAYAAAKAHRWAGLLQEEFRGHAELAGRVLAAAAALAADFCAESPGPVPAEALGALMALTGVELVGGASTGERGGQHERH